MLMKVAVHPLHSFGINYKAVSPEIQPENDVMKKLMDVY
jgi:hypothetical protein